MFFTSQHVEGTLFLPLFDLRFLFPPCCSAINRPVPSLSLSTPPPSGQVVRDSPDSPSGINKCFRRNLESRCYNTKYSRAIRKPLEQNGEQRKPATSFFDRTKNFFLTNSSFSQMPEVEEIPFVLFFFFETDDRPTLLSTCPCLKDNPSGRERGGGGGRATQSAGERREWA